MAESSVPTTLRNELASSQSGSTVGRMVRSIARFARRKPLAGIGLAIVLFMMLVAALADVIATSDPFVFRTSQRMVAPNSEFWLGTDNYGRDLFSRIVYGARISIFIGFVSVALGTVAGALMGLVSGYFGGATDSIIQRITDSLLAFPTLILALAIVSVLGASTFNVILAIAVALTPTASRVVRSAVLTVRNVTYIESARAVGCREWRILFVHVMPNCLAPFIILATIALGTAILSEASLSFLGLGTPPPEPSWGAMLSGSSQRFLREAPWMAIFPGIAISLAVFAFNMLGDGLRDVLDPRLRSR